MPYPGRGHINPMMNFCKLLATKFSVKEDIRITFVVTEEWLGFLGSETKSRLPPQIQLKSIPNVIPSELMRGLDHKGFFEAVQTKMEEPFEQILDQLQQDDDPSMVVTAILADTLLPWAVSVGNRRNIAMVSLWTTSPSLFSIVYHTDRSISLQLIDYIPGVAPIRLSDMPACFEAVSAVRNTRCLLLTTYHELEPRVTKTLMEILPVPVYTVGPSIPLPTTLVDDHAKMDTEDYYVEWLDSQPENSVLYVSFGSFLSASSDQMEEILGGLRQSGARYLLVSRGGKDNKMDNSRGIVVPWCDQLKVLCHPSVGGFWTHCGWNSTLEGIYAGIPLLTFPVGLDQFTNRKLIVDYWNIGMNVMKKDGAERLVTREDVSSTVRKFMNLDGDDEESKDMRTRASEFKKSCRQALTEGGSSTTNLDNFIRNILQYNLFF
ncbi:hypothetical protein MKW94_005543 [Papaver nudicaule]|uniref:Uncharacterized protein n=1 Tax=Papaver nudicaule TaxID=74823 RepID=A0AA41SEV3_PAPNU|nr:hypothetical protein [Papaver nudicaule]